VLSADRTARTEDPLWRDICLEAQAASREEPTLASFYHASILNHNSFACAISFHLATKLGSQTVSAMMLREVFQVVLARDSETEAAMRADLRAHCERDPACQRYSTPLLFFKGYHALQAYRFAHYLWREGRRSLALFLQNQISQTFDVDIHPAARIGRGIMIDHATGLVVGETAVIADDVSILHSVTLGAADRKDGDRHPKVGTGVLISTGAKILGNITLGEGAKIGAGSVVLESVPPHTTLAGVPARPVGRPKGATPARDMDHGFNGEDD